MGNAHDIVRQLRGSGLGKVQAFDLLAEAWADVESQDAEAEVTTTIVERILGEGFPFLDIDRSGEPNSFCVWVDVDNGLAFEVTVTRNPELDKGEGED